VPRSQRALAEESLAEAARPAESLARARGRDEAASGRADAAAAAADAAFCAAAAASRGKERAAASASAAALVAAPELMSFISDTAAADMERCDPRGKLAGGRKGRKKAGKRTAPKANFFAAVAGGGSGSSRAKRKQEQKAKRSRR